VSTVHVVVPEGLDDPRRPTGGNIYDRQVCDGLTAIGWRVVQYAAPGSWPWPDPDSVRELARLIAGLVDGSLLLIDGLIASAVPTILVPEADRLRLVVLVHMSLGEALLGDAAAQVQEREGAVVSAAHHVVATSWSTRDVLLRLYALHTANVHVAQPGVDLAELVPGTDRGGELLCVAAVTRRKGHDVLIAALATIADLPWRCVCLGALDVEPMFVEQLRLQAEAAGIGDRVHFPGPRIGEHLWNSYAAADVLVLASRVEPYGMVVTEALARGLPVIATAAGGLPEALGWTNDGRRPGLLVPPDDSRALAAALRDWLVDADLRQRLREAARECRSTLSGWDAPTDRIARVLTQAATP
jgi:glycosyltransferase involved in cell wall biosynthesis